MEEDVTVLFRAQVVTKTDPLNLREQPAAGSRKVGELAKGRMVDVLDTATNAGWWKVRYGALVGYASEAYLARVYKEASVEMDGESVNDAVAESIDTTTLVREDGDGVVTLIGRWRVAQD